MVYASCTIFNFYSHKALMLLLTLMLFSNIFAQSSFPRVKVEYDSAKAWTFENLQIIPIRYIGGGGKAIPALQNTKLISLQEAVRKEKVKISEIPGASNADVKVLIMRNTGKETIIINSGEIVSGGKQDRIIAETTIIPPGKEKHYIDVFCVEKGRWSRRPKGFGYHRSADVALRRVMDIEKLQQKIWEQIEGQYKASGKSSDTWAYKNLYKDPRFIEADSAYVKFFTNKFAQSDSNYAGFIAITSNQIIVTDLFATKEMTSAAFLTLLRSYSATAITLGETPEVPMPAVKKFMDPILSDDRTRDRYVSQRGRVFKYEGKVIQITAYGD
jgi:hypothetical protein